MGGQSRRHSAVVFAVLALSACTETVIRDGKIGTTSALYTTADIRVVTERPSPTGPARMLVCTEPSPDVAKALSTASQLSAKAASGPEAAISLASAEAAAELAGRTTALLGLRDGLYKACEAYANGAIGGLAYLFVLNRYGQLMTTLFLGQDAQGSAGAAELARIQSPNLGSGNPATNGTAGKSNSGAASPAPAAPGGVPGAAPKSAMTAADADTINRPTGNGLIRLAGWPPQMAGAAAEARPPAAVRAAPGTAASTKKPQSTKPVDPSAPSARTPSAGAAVSADLTKMNGDFLTLNTNGELLHLMILACLEEFDPTRATPQLPDGGAARNVLLEENCRPFIGDVMKRLPALAAKVGK